MSCCRVGVVFSGRQSPGGHNVIWGLHNAIKVHNPNSTLLGFVGKPFFFMLIFISICLRLGTFCDPMFLDY